MSPPGKKPEPEPARVPKAEPELVTEEDAALGKGGSLFAPVGWKPSKDLEEDEE